MATTPRRPRASAAPEQPFDLPPEMGPVGAPAPSGREGALTPPEGGRGGAAGEGEFEPPPDDGDMFQGGAADEPAFLAEAAADADLQSMKQEMEQMISRANRLRRRRAPPGRVVHLTRPT